MPCIEAIDAASTGDAVAPYEEHWSMKASKVEGSHGIAEVHALARRVPAQRHDAC